MTKFLNIFKKPCFCPIFGPFFQFLEQKNFSRKFGSVPHNFIWISSNIPNIRKKLMIQFKKKKHLDRRTEGWKTLFQRSLPTTAGGPGKYFT